MTRANAQAANALTNLVFGLERPIEHFMWKFWENPAGDPVAWMGLDSETGEIQSENIGLSKKVRVKGQDAKCIMLCESATRPSARGGGLIYKGVTSCVGIDAGASGFTFAYGGQSTDDAIKIGKRWFGYRVAFTLDVWEKRLSFAPALEHRLGAFGRLLAPLADLFLSSQEAATSSFQFEEVAECGEEFDELWSRHRDQYALCFFRTAQILNWRYVNCPIGPNRIVLARKNGRAVGYVIWREGRVNGIPIATILDLWHGDESGVAEALLAHASIAARVSGATCLRFAVHKGGAEHRAIMQLKNTRPSPFEKEDRVIVTPLPMAVDVATEGDYGIMRAAIDGRNWYYTQGDCDYLD